MKSLMNSFSNHGHLNSFLQTLIAFLLGSLILYAVFLALDPLLIELYDTRDSLFINQYRSSSGKIWRMLFRLHTGYRLLLLPILFLFSLGIAQLGLKNNYAKYFNLICMLFFLLTSLLTTLLFFTLMITPMGLISTTR